MPDTEQNGSAVGRQNKPLSLQLSIAPDQATEFIAWLGDIVEKSVASKLPRQQPSQGQTEQSAKLAESQHASLEPKVKGIDLTEAAKIKAADVRIAVLLGKIPDDTGILINAKVAAKLLNISLRTFRRLQAEGATPDPVRIGDKIARWRLAELLDWIENGCPPRKHWHYRGQAASTRRGGR